jgi:hypothetical protein
LVFQVLREFPRKLCGNTPRDLCAPSLLYPEPTAREIDVDEAELGQLALRTPEEEELDHDEVRDAAPATPPVERD